MTSESTPAVWFPSVLEYGGGTISFDGEVIRRDGLFVTDDLLALNPENLS